MIWEPYNHVMATLPPYCSNGHDIWRTVSPLICFHIVEWHLPNRVIRQFGMKQLIPEVCNTEPRLHTIDLRHADWSIHLGHYLVRWHSRANFIAASSPIDADGDMAPDYMDWYENITRRFITREGASYGQAVRFQFQVFLIYIKYSLIYITI